MKRGKLWFLIGVGALAVASVGRSLAQERPRRAQHPVVAALDTDKDGAISEGELNGAGEALKGLDQNKDGKLSGEEIAPRFRPSGRRGRTGRVSSFDSTPMPKTEAEQRILNVLGDMRRNPSRGMSNVPLEDGRLLRLLTETVGAKHVVEIGTSNGYSALWFCLALRTTGGKLTTHEIDKRRAAMARENFKRAGVDAIATVVEGDAHKEVTKLKEPIDILFLDADKQGYIDYLNKCLPLVKPGGLIVAHNITQRMADPRYVKAITNNPELETVFLPTQGAGVSLTLKKRQAAGDRPLK